MSFRTMLGAVDDYLGDDDDFLGAPARRGAGPRFGRPTRRMPARQVAAALDPVMPGIPKAGARIEPLGFPEVVFTNTSGLSLQVTTRPQKPFKGSRLVVDVARTGAGATGAIKLSSLVIGSRNVLVNSNPIGVGTFAANADGVALMLDEVTPGVDIVATFTCSVAPGAGERIDVVPTLIGLTLGA
jgi:hypothetical protein